MHRFVSLTFAVVLLLLATDVAADPPVVRVLSPRLAQTLCRAARVSPTLRALLNELERSDLIVHVTGRPITAPAVAWHGLAGTMQFVTATPTRRFLRVTVDESLPQRRRAAVLAHELWHALEVSREPHVIDRRSFEALYQHIGHPTASRATGWYDTKGAVHAGSTVLREIQRADVSW